MRIKFFILQVQSPLNQDVRDFYKSFFNKNIKFKNFAEDAQIKIETIKEQIQFGWK